MSEASCHRFWSGLSLMLAIGLIVLLPAFVCYGLIAFTEQGRGLFYAVMSDPPFPYAEAVLPIGLLINGAFCGLWCLELAPSEAADVPDESAFDWRRALWTGSLLTALIATLALPVFVELSILALQQEAFGGALESALDEIRRVLWLTALAEGLIAAKFHWRLKQCGEPRSTLFLFLAVPAVLAGPIVASTGAPFSAITSAIAGAAVLLLTPMLVARPQTYPPRIERGALSQMAIGAPFLCILASSPLLFEPAATRVASLGSGVLVMFEIFVILCLVALTAMLLKRIASIFDCCSSPAARIGTMVYLLIAGSMPMFAVYNTWSAFPMRGPIRTLDISDPPSISLSSYLETWLASRTTKVGRGETYPIFLVLAPGGGIRAAYWTAGLLGEIQDRDSSFAEHVIAISGVSGGAVGAAIFDALLAAKGEGALDGSKETLRGLARKILAQDHLSLPLSTMLTSDFLHAFYGSGVIHDRAVSLEKSFEEAWRKQVGTDNMQRPFRAMFDPANVQSPPALFLNVTLQSGWHWSLGVIAPVSLANEPAFQFPDLQRRLEKLPVRLSTASVASARFPLVSTSGVLPPDQTRGYAPQAEAEVSDGGIYDNSGAAVGATIVEAIRKVPKPFPITIYVLVLHNRPENAPAPGKADIPATLGIYPGYIAKAGIAREKIWMSEFKRSVQEAGCAILLPELRVLGRDAVLPLGWTLARNAREDLDLQIDDQMKDGGALSSILKILGNAGGSIPNSCF